jgi:hypothetical protein
MNACSDDAVCEPCLQSLSGTVMSQCMAAEAMERKLRGMLSQYCSANPKILDSSIKCAAQFYANECKSAFPKQLTLSATALLVALVSSISLWRY